ncbi:GumC family protein [Flavobacterium sp. TSSA_36]|uniref:GumC family protein n=1 Tax=Flavobacterium sp. TSSA_36 TaxID=3447669 RepID=UPI003F3303B1
MNIPENEYAKHIAKDFEIMIEIRKYLYQWRWFVLAIVLFLTLAFVYLRYTVPQYKVTTTVLVKDDSKGGLMSELSAFSDLGFGKGKSNVDNEIEILKSRSLLESTVEQLQFQVQLFVQGNVKTTEVYGAKGLHARFSGTNSLFATSSTTLQIQLISGNRFRLSPVEGEEASATGILVGKGGEFTFGQPILTKVGVLRLESDAVRKAPEAENFLLVLRPVDQVVDALMGSLAVAPLSKTSSVVSLSMVHAVPEKAEVFLNQLVQNYNANAITDKNFISENTSKFIANRLLLISQELDGVEKDVQTFKQDNKLTDIETQAELFVKGSSEYDKKGVETAIQLDVLSSMLGALKNNKQHDLLPGNLLSSTGEESKVIGEYNKLLLDRNRLLKSATEENPTVIRLDEQIQAMKQNVAASLRRLQASLEIQKRDLDVQQGAMNVKIDKIPTQERQFRVIARQQKVKEELYLYLLQKREETAIALSATEANARVVDKARANPIAVSPKGNVIYLAAFLLGLLVPFGVIYLKELLDTKITSRLDLDKLSTIPFIGDVPTSDSPGELMHADSRSSSAEALRIIRTNLEFMFTKVPEGTAKTLFLTSTFPTEGKTFVSVNLASTFALSGKKVLLIGMDIRSPRLSDYMAVPERGVTNYLSSKDANWEDFVVKHPSFEDFWILPAGVVPPNPAELLMSKKVDDLFKALKSHYDYIIVDTAPVSLVTDTLLIAKHADTFVYVARANYLEKRMLAIPNTLYKEHKLPNMCLLLNDTDSTKGYGYGYGYGATVTKKPWYQRIFVG